MRKLLPLIFFCVLSLASATSYAASQAKEALSPADIKRVENYLNNITTMEADFLQIAPSGESTTGIFYLSRPGKLRWQYNPPTPILIIANGSLISYYDSELKQASYLPANSSLAAFLTRPKIKFSDDVEIINTRKTTGLLRVSIIQKGKKQEGQLTLICSDNPLTLRKIEVIDTSDQLTTVTLSDIKYGRKLEKDLFILKEVPVVKKREF